MRGSGGRADRRVKVSRTGATANSAWSTTLTKPVSPRFTSPTAPCCSRHAGADRGTQGDAQLQASTSTNSPKKGINSYQGPSSSCGNSTFSLCLPFLILREFVLGCSWASPSRGDTRCPGRFNKASGEREALPARSTGVLQHRLTRSNLAIGNTRLDAQQRRIVRVTTRPGWRLACSCASPRS
jgi:hypothetical protein